MRRLRPDPPPPATSPTVTAPSGVLDVSVVYINPGQHCCQESSDEEAYLEDEGCQDLHALAPSTQTPLAPGPEPHLCSSRELGKDITTSGYSSVSASPTNSLDGGPPQSTSALSPGSDSNTQPCHHHTRKSCLQCRPPSSLESSVPQQQVKRKNLSAPSKEENTNLGFLEL